MSRFMSEGSEKIAGGRDVSLFAERSRYVSAVKVQNAAGIDARWLL